MEARVSWDAAMASGNKSAQQAAEAAFMATKEAEGVAGQAAAAAAAAASSASAAASAAASVSAAAASVSAAAQEVAASAEVAEVAQDATRAAQEATLAALQEIEAQPGGTTWDAWGAQAAIEQVKAEMEGRSFSGQFGNSYEESMAEIDRMRNSGKSAAECASQSGC